MKNSQDPDTSQIASGTGIAQATTGGTASVSIGFTAEEVERLLAKVMEGTALPLSNAMVLVRPELNTEAPIRPEQVLKRTTLQQRVEQTFLAGRAVLLRGDAGSGRTELARSISESRTQVRWLDLHANQHLSPESALDLFLKAFPATGSEGLSNTGSQEGVLAKTCLIIDNVDDAIFRPEFETKMKSLASKGTDGVSIILISLHPLPRAISSLFEDIEVSRLDDGEIRELMRLYGAPKGAFQPGLVNLVEGVTHGMPDLVALILKDWQSKGWSLDDTAWLDLLQATYATDLRAETQRRLLAMEDSASSDLLYRLTLLGRDFSEKEVISVAALEPAIERAGERLQSLSGRWLHRVKNNRWRTSPLLAGSGENNLLQPLRVAVHSAIVEWVFAKKTLNQLGVQEAIMHLLQAGRYNDAAVVYIRALHSLLEAELDAYPGMLLSFWKSLPLPAQMDLGLRIFIRGLQVANGLRRGEEYQDALDDLIALVAQARDWRDQVSVYTASALVGIQLATKDAAKALPFIAIAAQGERLVPEEARGYLNDHAATELFWLAAMNASLPADVLAWMREVAKLSPEERQFLMTTEFAADSALKMFSSLWWVEQDKPDDERNWPVILECLRQCEELAASWNAPLISACILRSRFAVQIVHLKDTEQAEAEYFYSANQTNPVAIFIIADGLATWFVDADRWDLASTWLTRAYMYDGPGLPLTRQLNSLRYGHLLLREGAPSIVPFERAIAIGEADEKLTIFNQLKARAEMVTYQWKIGEISECYSNWCIVARGLLEHREDDTNWKHFFMLAANNTAFYCWQFGRTTASEAMVTEPRPGMFVGGMQSLADRYQPGLVFLMPGGMSQWADELGKEREASEWAELAASFGRDVSRNDLALMYKMYAVPLDIRGHRFVDALIHANDAAIGMLSEVPLPISEDRRSELQSQDLDGLKPRKEGFARLVRLNIGFLPALLEISVRAERQPEEVRAQLGLLQSEAKKMRKNDSETWDIAAQILEEIAVGQLRWIDLRGTPPNGADGRQDVASTLRCFGMWVNSSASVKDLLLAQASCVPYLAAYFPQLGHIGTTVCLSIARMWAAKIEHSPYHFRRPTETISRVNQLAAEAQLGEMMIVLADSIGVGMEPNTRKQFKDYRLRKLLLG